MVNARISGRTLGDSSSREEPTGDQFGNGPLLENPTLAQVMAGQAQMMATMMQQMQQQHQQMMQQQQQQAQYKQQQNQQNQQNGPPPPPPSKLLEFLRVRPLTFSSTTNPMEANDWLDAIEKKLNLLQCTDEEKVVFATHQLQGPGLAWWDNYIVTRPAGTEVTWAEFCRSYRKAQVPDGIVAQKKREFRTLH